MPISMVLSDYVAEFLAGKGIDHVFGYQGGAVTKIIDSMVNGGRIRFVQNYHEQASALAADGSARISGKVGVAVATSGPGATNLVTGIANAQLDSIPVLFITGQDYAHNISKTLGRLNGFQDLDIVSVVKSITKYAVTVTDPSRIRYELEKAFYLAANGRPGATLIDLPIDIQFKTIVPEELEGYVPSQEPSLPVHTKDLETVLTALRGARRPLVLAGGGVRLAKAEQALRHLIDATGLPVVTTLNGLDVIEGGLGFAGLYGNTEANLAVYNADLLLVLGARLGQRQVGKVVEKYTHAHVIHVDIDPEELRRVITDSTVIHADIRTFIEALTEAVGTGLSQDWPTWWEMLRGWQREFGKNVHVSVTELDPVRFLTTLVEGADDDAIFAADVGQNQMWLAQAFKVRGQQRLLNSSGLGAMGYSLPAAIGARIASDSAQVIAVTGDGGLQMNLQELNLIGHKALNIKCIVMNNNTLGMMREVQKRYYGERYYGADEESFSCPDLERLAYAFGLDYIKVTSEDSAPDVLAALRKTGPCLIDVRVDFDSLLLNRYDELHVFEANTIHDPNPAS